MSIELWWLKMNTAGRCDQRFSSPTIRSRTPASASAASEPTDVAKLAASRRLRLSRPIPAPSAPAAASPASAAPVRTTVSTPGRPRPENRYDGPAAVLGDLGKSVLRIERARIADGVEEVHVLVAVAVAVAALEVDAAPAREVTHRARLRGAPKHLAVQLAREHALLHTHRGRQQMLHVEVRRQRGDLVARG